MRAYQELAELDPRNAWSWHKLSLLRLKAERIKEAEVSNAQALRLMDFPAAHEVQEYIQKQKQSRRRGLLGLFSRN